MNELCVLQDDVPPFPDEQASLVLACARGGVQLAALSSHVRVVAGRLQAVGREG
jgi:hypothetical protein